MCRGGIIIIFEVLRYEDSTQQRRKCGSCAKNNDLAALSQKINRVIFPK